MSATAALVVEKSDRRSPLISITFSYGLLSLIVSAKPSDPFLDLAKIGIFGGLLSAFLSLVDPVNRLAAWLMPRMFGTHDSVSWTLDAMGRMPALMRQKVDIAPSTERIALWARNSYYSPYLSNSRTKIVAETYFGVGLIVVAIGSFLQIQGIFRELYLTVVCLAAASAILFSSFFHFLELISRAHIVAIFEMMITFGVPLSNFEGLKSLLASGNWSEARSWILRELGLPWAPWHWITVEPKYSRLIAEIDNLSQSWGVIKVEETMNARQIMNDFSANLRSIANEVAEKNGVKSEGKTMLELATIFFERGIINARLYRGIEIIEQILLAEPSDEVLRLVGNRLLLIMPKMEEELRQIAQEK